MAQQQSTFAEEMMAAGRGVIGLLTGDRQAGSYFDLSNRGLAGSFIALLLILNSLTGWIYTYTIKSFPSPFPQAMALGRFM